MRFWLRIFALAFGMGVITGLVLSYEIGTNWAGFSRSVANVLGPLFAYETLTAFFLEASSGNTDPQPAHVPIERSFVVRDRLGRGCRIGCIMAGDGV